MHAVKNDFFCRRPLLIPFIIFPTQSKSEFEFSWTCLKSLYDGDDSDDDYDDGKNKDYYDDDEYKKYYDDDGEYKNYDDGKCNIDVNGILKKLGQKVSSTVSLNPKAWGLKPETYYEFQVSVRSKIGNQNDASSRLVCLIFVLFGFCLLFFLSFFVLFVFCVCYYWLDKRIVTICTRSVEFLSPLMYCYRGCKWRMPFMVIWRFL